jgi:hypothetical protein
MREGEAFFAEEGVAFSREKPLGWRLRRRPPFCASPPRSANFIRHSLLIQGWGTFCALGRPSDYERGWYWISPARNSCCAHPPQTNPQHFARVSTARTRAARLATRNLAHSRRWVRSPHNACAVHNASPRHRPPARSPPAHHARPPRPPPARRPLTARPLRPQERPSRPRSTRSRRRSGWSRSPRSRSPTSASSRASARQITRSRGRRSRRRAWLCARGAPSSPLSSPTGCRAWASSPRATSPTRSA